MNFKRNFYTACALVSKNVIFFYRYRRFLYSISPFRNEPHHSSGSVIRISVHLQKHRRKLRCSPSGRKLSFVTLISHLKNGVDPLEDVFSAERGRLGVKQAVVEESEEVVAILIPAPSSTKKHKIE